MYNKASLTIKLKLVAIGLLAGVSCTMHQSTAQTIINQGIEGHIYRLSGNQMPMKGKPTKRNGKGVTRELWIYTATRARQARGQMPLFDQINSRLVTKIKSDSTGYYKVGIPAGKYSVFVKEGSRFFAAETDEEGTLNPVTVAHGKLTERNITITGQAAFKAHRYYGCAKDSSGYTPYG